MARRVYRLLPLRLIARLVASAVALLFLVCACTSPSQELVPSQGKEKTAALSDKQEAAKPGIGFASRQKWIDHYQKHGREFGSISREQYLRKAQELRDRPAGGDILEHERNDGVITRFDRASGDFIAYNANGVIRTYFRPNDGEAYFRRQTLRRHEP
ncbi:MAG TPA: hypothetical protein PLR20_14245 [Syntrophales bacterium]|nr:hypothetical protein [Syntrophales bacterium]HOX94029.1 hypothetical protein [Syntrophales bacterium]HPI58311.1 hypothetical protein [Syntrophales bacterium]HPN26129.1 hypothetical protein [Syntrophales bacterium]HQM30506.1 hypothetical protein [Syntrophales bacterium]